MEAGRGPGPQGKLDQVARVRVRAGWFSGGICCSDKASGPGWKGFPIKGKEMARQWVGFYGTLPNFVA